MMLWTCGHAGSLHTLEWEPGERQAERGSTPLTLLVCLICIDTWLQVFTQAQARADGQTVTLTEQVTYFTPDHGVRHTAVEFDR